MGLHRRFLDGVGSAEAVLEVVARAQVLELRLDHCPQVAGGVVAELDYAARVAIEDENHSTPDLGGRHCHNVIPVLRSETEDRRRGICRWAPIETKRKRKQP